MSTLTTSFAVDDQPPTSMHMVLHAGAALWNQTEERDLQDLFGKYGELMDVFIPRERG